MREITEWEEGRVGCPVDERLPLSRLRVEGIFSLVPTVDEEGWGGAVLHCQPRDFVVVGATLVNHLALRGSLENGAVDVIQKGNDRRHRQRGDVVQALLKIRRTDRDGRRRLDGQFCAGNASAGIVSPSKGRLVARRADDLV